ncbi:hypothetical protein N7510_003819 [Penicillium lagena]|uniref:uncharacterized protein n=1 Tax=Penicillium lagena TaxID=94218 RepID=UPI0025420929|nr:uncharacterized protein N7510_003819 [Penicillium lagena]KAJ5619835.1 hypothetical protein N7510_003819 [Penicillium lagena]
MTRLRGASIDSPDEARSAGNERPQFHRCKLPPNAPEVVAQNTIELSDSSCVLPWYRDERRRRFNVLVRKYKQQLLHGCRDPGCRTPTCASYRRRVSEGPYRRYTELSARTLACYLASQDDAESGLCCNAPRSPTEIELLNYHRISLQRSRAFNAEAAAARHPSPGDGSAVDENSTEHLVSGGRTDTPEAANDDAPQTVDNLQLQELDYTAEQPLKDPKSFTQNLFDTLSLRMVEWLPLRRVSDTYQLKTKPPPTPPETTNRERIQNQEATGTAKSHDLPTFYSGHSSANPRTPSSRTTGSQASAVEVRFPNQQVKRLSVSEIDPWRQSPRPGLGERKRPDYKNKKVSVNASNDLVSMSSPPALKHRSQKHRGRIGDADTPSTKKTRKNNRRVSWDGEKVLNQAAMGASPEPAPMLPAPLPSDIQSPSDRKAKRASHSQPYDQGPLAQTVTHLSAEIIGGLGQMMAETEEDAENWKEELSRIESTGNFDNPDWQFATSRQRQVFPFVAQSVFYVFGSARQIVRSFEREMLESNASKQKTMASRLDLSRLQVSLRRLFAVCPWDIALHSLWSALDRLFVPPEELTSSGRPSRRSSRSSTLVSSAAPPVVVRRPSESVDEEHLSDADAAHVATVTLFALVSSVPELDADTWRGVLRMRAAGNVASPADMHNLPPEHVQRAVEVTDKLEHELGLRLVNRLVRALVARLTYHEISKSRQIYNSDVPKQRKASVLDRVVEHLSDHRTLTDPDVLQVFGPISLIIEWLRTLFLREWDGNPEMLRSSAAGGAIQILASMYKERRRLGLEPEDFHTPLLAERLDPLEMPVAWASRLANNRTMHLLSYPFLFPPSSLVIYFRALNYSAMSKYYESSMTTTRHVTQTAFSSTMHLNDDMGILARMKTSMSTYLVLVVRRDNVLGDALNQLWRREKRELMRPLKVQMGMDEGEEGLDHGGVQQEFFRVLMAEALDPSYGMLTLDTRHRISWFRPCSLEPLYKFELLGLLMSIAVYNGLTLPVNFPIAFYRKLLGLKVKHLSHIRDGWPELVQGLETMMSWKDGDVGDIFMRTYEFSFESFGRVETVDMQKTGRDAMWPLPSGIPEQNSMGDSTAWSDVPHYFDQAIVSPPSSMAAEAADRTPGQPVSGDTAKSVMESQPIQFPIPPSDEAALVTNRNRHQFVKDYVFWLTDKSIRPQFEAFARGFNTCLDRSALSIFTPEALKTVVEGIQEIDIQALENHSRYEGGFGPKHRVIRDFWSVVSQYPADKKAQLLEFVTASDRVPVNGISSIMFVIQKNGVGDLRLPTSLTCFGRLLLPEYSSREALAEKLDKALENARGFGVA